MPFLEQQCVSNVMMLAELKAVESTGPSELQPLVQKVSTKIEKHLESCKELATKLEDDGKNKQS